MATLPLKSRSKKRGAVDKRRKRFALWFCLGTLILLFLGALFYLAVGRFYRYTDDAYVEGNLIMITPLHEGFITAIHTDDTFFVKQGALIVELDETDAKIAFEKAKEDLANTVRMVCQAFHQVFAYQAEIEMQKAELVKATQDLEHRTKVLDAGGVSLENFEHAQAAYRSTFYALKRAESLYEKEKALVQGTTITSHPLVIASSQRLIDAWVYLYRCKIYAPVDGLIAQRTAQVGMWFKAGDPLMGLIPLDQIWVNANFKETQMKKMRIGQKARVTSDLYGEDVPFHGVVVGLPGGAGNAFSLLPPQNLSGNWIKIVQRLPVRIALDPEEVKQHPLRLGLSMEALVDVRDTKGALVPTTSAGSPLYETPIFKKEEEGSSDLVLSIIDQNLDPSLIYYANNPLILPVDHDKK